MAFRLPGPLIARGAVCVVPAGLPAALHAASHETECTFVVDVQEDDRQLSDAGLSGLVDSVPFVDHDRRSHVGKSNDQLSLIGMVFSRDGATFGYAHEWDTPEHAYELGAFVAASLIRKNARSIIAGTRLH